ncbi:MAG: sensor histidine kinase [Actinobacteria bacterium]|jgi:signal transduction histidine kinase|nr:sensor histidine kinase [Actinomycetota bacterium]
MPSSVPYRVAASTGTGPFRDWRFWVAVVLCAGIVGGQMLLDSHAFNIFPDSDVPALLILPILYGALRFGLSGSVALTAWVVILWIPDIVIDGIHGETLDMTGDIIMVAIVIVVGVFAGWRMQREHDLNDAYKAARSKVEAYAQAVLSGLEDERSRIARELHDETLQTLIQLGRKVSAVSKAPDLPGSARDAMAQARQLVDESVKGLREVVRGLRPPALEDLGLEVALARLAEDAATDSLEVEFEVLGKAPSRILDDDTELALYRIAQEALSNVARHSGARHGSMTLHFGEDAVELEIVDDGIGFRVSDDFLSAGSTGTGGWGFIGPDGFYHGEHFGMLGMYERAQLVGGNLYVQSAPGRGSTVRAYVPYV